MLSEFRRTHSYRDSHLDLWRGWSMSSQDIFMLIEWKGYWRGAGTRFHVNVLAYMYREYNTYQHAHDMRTDIIVVSRTCDVQLCMQKQSQYLLSLFSRLSVQDEGRSPGSRRHGD